MPLIFDISFSNTNPTQSRKSRRDHSRFVCCGDAASGKIHLRDPLNLKVMHTLDTNTGVLSDFDVHGHHLVTCGQSLRHGGVPQPDRFLMVYDLRVRLKENILCNCYTNIILLLYV